MCVLVEQSSDGYNYNDHKIVIFYDEDLLGWVCLLYINLCF